MREFFKEKPPNLIKSIFSYNFIKNQFKINKGYKDSEKDTFLSLSRYKIKESDSSMNLLRLVTSDSDSSLSPKYKSLS